MRLTILGGAAAGPGPHQGCSGYLIEAGGARIVLDLGPGTLTELRHQTELPALDAIVVSHMHVDHILDLFSLWWGWIHTPQPLPRLLSLWLPPGGHDRLMATVRTLAAEPDEIERLATRVFHVREYDPSAPLQIGAATLRFAPTRHYIPCWAIRVDVAGESSLIYTADNGDAARLVPFAAGAGVLIAEASLPDVPPVADAGRGVSAATEVAALARDAGVQTLVLTHIWPEHDAEAARTTAASVFNGRIEIARPGLTLCS
ncbi:MAG TPA: MBL fold metallo-hydrolase [Thermomicrobiales bacterium]|nr:MBL fold metallo-hydrolase [Thermomicrobiales bacterium]